MTNGHQTSGWTDVTDGQSDNYMLSQTSLGSIINLLYYTLATYILKTSHIALTPSHVYIPYITYVHSKHHICTFHRWHIYTPYIIYKHAIHHINIYMAYMQYIIYTYIYIQEGHDVFAPENVQVYNKSYI